ncbi:MAG: type IIA DNA topoisomerase subunit B [Myxococcales bacterium]|nr:type IIA DNA topoisomerase subunit B [Myxococcales bacterium]
MTNNTYGAEDIVVLEGLEAVRKRPGMYIGGVHKTGLHHLLWEIVDNAIDEAINGHANRIVVTLHGDGETISVDDNGRGIPVGMHPQYKKPALELILTTLHSGGKFGSSNYIHSGGLHGVGISVVNALSDKMRVRVKRDGKLHEQHFSRGFPQDALNVVRNVRGTGTEVTFHADPEIFHDGVALDALLIRERLNIRSYLHRGLEILWCDQSSGEEHRFYHEGGIEDFLQHMVTRRDRKIAHEGIFAYRGDGELRMEIALCWTDGTDEQFHSFVNGIPTKQGGTHENGLKSALVKAIRQYINLHKLQPKGIQFTPEDIREGLVALLSVYIGDPQFQGQTKERLNNVEVQPLVEGIARSAFEQWLNENSSIARSIVGRILMAAKARAASRAASQVVRRQSPTRRLNLPGKLADCAESDPDKCELFIVEGDSAGGSAKMGRDRKTQAILPLRGKVMNTENANLKKVIENKELSDIVQALGCGVGKHFSLENLRYNKIILLMDADADGHHIATLLLTFFYRHMTTLLHNGHVYIAQPPLYRIEINKKVHWVLDDDQRHWLLAQAPPDAKVDIQRFKGLGEMMPDVLRQTTLDPKKRTLLRVSVDDELQTNALFENLMGKDARFRGQFIKERATELDEVDVAG